ncbi:MAG: hypothetical protein IH994_00785 [Proteobacteria bacterium]|nr:hypothetical protein [Pseudomonadota bacterium]
MATWLAAVGTIGAVVVVLTAEWWWRKLHGPRLRLSFGADADYQTFTIVTDNQTGKAVGGAHYIRVKVQNSRKATAEKCRAYLVNIEKFNDAEDNFESTLFCDSIRLKWSCMGRDSDSVTPLDLPNGVNQFVDLIETQQGHSVFSIQMHPHMNRYEYLQAEKGIFRFTVLVTGNRVVPKKIPIIFEWSGVWDEFKAYRG